MKIEPNLGRLYRAFCIVVGLILIGLPFAASMEGWICVAAPILGVLSVVTGITGW